MIPRVETERLLLREWRDSDLDFFASLYGNPDVTRYLGDGSTMDRDQAWRAMAGAAGHWALRGYGQWVLELRETGEAIGRSGLYNPEGWPGLEAGWVVAPEHQGKGYATEAGAASLRFAFEKLGADHVISLIYQDNLPSIGVAKRLGGVGEKMYRFPNVEVLVFGYDRAPQTL
ncbi:MAG TPA: GNAT family N-acetyltransferase [Candidatus Dormibacteraeota bacterium]|nr:GNAT family N-acetyltransferase [Candidatus Dormibacteraeota bacterium]